MTTQPLLIELVTEELPPKSLRKLGDSFAGNIEQGLNKLQLLPAGYKTHIFATPRRLAVYFNEVLAQAPEQEFSEKLMPVKVGINEQGQATPALLKKLAAKGLQHLSADELTRQSDGKQDYLFASGKAAGAHLASSLQHVVEQSLEQLPIPKVMRYQLADGVTSVHFVRPAHRLVVLYGQQVLPLTLLGIQAGRETMGHRFMGQASFAITKPSQYAAQLAEQGKVIASYNDRREMIRSQLLAKAAELNSTIGENTEVEDLLEEVNSLVEHPTVYVGKFEEKFLAVPQECLILTMRLNQKYFPLFNQATGKLTNHFLIVSNMELADPHNIIEGNERVIRPRLADAEFFFNTDKKTPLTESVQHLANVVYHNKLGSQLERSQRVAAIARYLAKQLHADADLAEKSAMLAKADLTSSMVGEFPELQGIMGSYYAQAAGEPIAIVQALARQYQVRYEQAVERNDLTAIILFMAERVETLIGIWGIGMVPTGDRDPYALRRAALGLISAYEQLSQAGCFDNQTTLPLDNLLDFAVSTFKAELNASTSSEVQQFILERYRNQLQNDYARSAIDAVLALNPPLNEVVARLQAVSEFNQLPEAESLTAANKRIGNLLKKIESDLPTVTATLLQEPAEKNLATTLDLLRPQALQAFAAKDFNQTLSVMAAARPAVDQFFNDVMVMSDDLQLRNNRLALLNQLHQTMNLVADLARLA